MRSAVQSSVRNKFSRLEVFARASRHFVGGVLVAVVCLSTMMAQTSTAHAPLKGATKPPAPQAVNAEELQTLLKRSDTHPLLVNWWATWCDPCRDEFPDLVKIDNEYRARGLDFIAVSLDDLADLKTAVPKFLREMKATMPVYLLNVQDPEPAMAMVDREWSGALPATFLYNNKGELVYKHFGRINNDELRSEIDKLVGSKQ
jgi:thiol-disulfide isomerase/thioredoxin